MVQRREELGFALESRDAFVILRERRGQHLDRDVAIELRISRTEHLAHPARADGGGDLVRSESGSGGHGHGDKPVRAWPAWRGVRRRDEDSADRWTGI